MSLKAVFLATALLGAGPVFAQAAPEPAAPAAGQAPASATPGKTIAAGAAVLDAKGGAVGTIASVTGDVAVIDTGAVKASVPVTSLAASEKGVLIGMTKAELEAAAKGAAAGQQEQFLASLKPGTAVSDPSGGAVGTIEAIDADTITVATGAAKAKLPKNAIAQGPNGAVIGMTKAELEAAAKGAAAPTG